MWSDGGVQQDDVKDGEWVGPVLPGPAGVLGLIGLRLGICVLNRDYHVIQHFAGKSTVRHRASRGCPLTSCTPLLTCVVFDFLFTLSHHVRLHFIMLSSVFFSSLTFHFILLIRNKTQLFMIQLVLINIF